jgi:hypothetical protein
MWITRIPIPLKKTEGIGIILHLMLGDEKFQNPLYYWLKYFPLLAKEHLMH